MSESIYKNDELENEVNLNLNVDVENLDFIPPCCDKNKEVDKINNGEEDGCNNNIEALKEELWRMTFAAFTLTLPILRLNTKSSSNPNSPHFQAHHSYILTQTSLYMTFFSCKSNI